MDRTEEFVSVLKVYGFDEWERVSLVPPSNTEFTSISLDVAKSIRNNEGLLKRIDKLTSRKEFSNDPTIELNELSEMFQLKLVSMKRDMETLKQKNSVRNSSSHQQQHSNHIMLSLQKKISAHIELFQNSMKSHAEHVEKRESRVNKYGKGSSEQVLAAAATGGVSASSTPYAMFGGGMGEVRRRRGGASGSGTLDGVGKSSEGGSCSVGLVGESSGNGSGSGHGRWKGPSPPVSGGSSSTPLAPIVSPYGSEGSSGNEDSQALQQSRLKRGRFKQQSAQKVEQSIAQMGRLFSQMSTLVMQQSEVITRIEDDVEAGLAETTEAHESMLYFHEITKGNRALILKVFGLLIFFILLFLYFT